MQPFDKHDADTVGLGSCGSTLIVKAAEGLTNGKLTKNAYQPAINSVTGVCSPQVQSADRAVQQGSQDVTAELTWAAVVSRYWGGQVSDFNTKVDTIVSTLNAAKKDDEDDDGGEEGDGEDPTAKAKRDWWAAYRTHIETGQTKVSAMLRDGPTKAHLQTAIDAGAMPPMSWDPGTPSEYWNGFLGIFTPPDGTATDKWIWGGKSAMLALSWWGHGYEKIGSQQFAPRGPNGRFIKFKGTPWWYRSRLSFSSNNWYTSRNTATIATTAKWSTYAKFADKTFYALSFAGGAYDQWTRDSQRTDLSTGEKVTRSATRGAVKLAGTYAGIETGAWAGGAIGGIIGGPPGAVIGSMIGGIVGGVIGSGLADEVADHVVEGVTTAYNWTGDRLEDAGEALSDIGDALTFWD